MIVFAFFLLLATFLSALMAGFLFAFAVVVMPGIGKLGDRDFLLSFGAIDRVIQNNQPLFMIMWLGSTISLLVVVVLVTTHDDSVSKWIIYAAACLNLFLIQVPTMTINVPLNNRLQALDLESLDDQSATEARAAFEPRWNRWNIIRTAVACIILAGLIVVLLRY